MRMNHATVATAATGLRVLIADDDAQVRSLFAKLLEAATGVAAVIEAEDGAEAVELSSRQDVDVVILDLNMPRLDGVEAARRLCAREPRPRIALHSSDPELLSQRAAGLELPLFDKLEFDRLLEWVERQTDEWRSSQPVGNGHVSVMARRSDLCCALCGYGIVCRTPPARCPMCGGADGWSEAPGSPLRRASLHGRLAG